MLRIMSTLLILYLASGLLLILLSIPLLLHKVRPNSLYGFRVQATLDDPEIWYAVNAYAARWLLICGILTILGALILFFVPDITIDAYALGVLAVFVIPLIIGLVLSFRYIRKIK
jgi:hypothetical protein